MYLSFLGIYNGALGTVVQFLFTNNPPPSFVERPYGDVTNRSLPVVLVQLDEDVHFSCMNDMPNVVPIQAKSYLVKKGVNRKQLPLIAAHASTIHSVQGLTAVHGVTLQPATSYNAQGLMYVACSRPRSLEDLWLLAPLQTKHFQYGRETYRKIEKEYKRLESLHNL